MAKTSYAIALGSNRRHGRHGGPRGVIAAAVAALAASGLQIVRVSAIADTAAAGGAGRRFANAAAILHSPLTPDALLRLLKATERGFGRRPGRRWGPRVLDLDILLWSGGAFAGRGLTVPHPGFRERGFVLAPLAEIAPAWRDPLTGLDIAHLAARLAAPRPVDRTPARS